MAGILVLAANQGVGAQSNLDTTGYPSHQCGEKPSEPIRPANFKSEAELAHYNHTVETFNATSDRYFTCVQRYVDNAINDIELIKQSLSATIEAANN